MSELFNGSKAIKKPLTKKKFWTIRAIEVDTVNTIKAKAREWGCTVPELLKTEFVNKPGWILYNFDQELRAKIEKDAQDKGMTISEFIRHLYNKEDKQATIDKMKKFLVDL